MLSTDTDPLRIDRIFERQELVHEVRKELYGSAGSRYVIFKSYIERPLVDHILEYGASSEP